ncbi:hypothetical protein B7P43_G13888, partial [Cryptotermes secundus]
ELVQDLAANSENQEHFGQGTTELGEDSVELEAAKEPGTELSERVRLAEGAEDSKRGDEEKGNDYELEAEECNQEGRTAEEIGKQEEAAQSEAGNEGEGIEDVVVSSNAENEDQEVRHVFPQPTDIQVHMEEALLDTSERLERRYSEEADIRDDSRNKTEDSEENEHTCELDECIEEVRFDTSVRPDGRICGKGRQEKEMVKNKKEGGEENSRDCKPDLENLEECTSDHSSRHLCEEAEKQKDVAEDEPQEGDEKGEYETVRTKMEECTEESRFGTSEDAERRNSAERVKGAEVLQLKTEAEEETELGYKSQPAKIDEGTKEVNLDTSEKSGSRLSDETGMEQEALGSKIQEGEMKQPGSELEMSAVKGSFIAVNLDTSKDSGMQLPEETEKRDVTQNAIQETLTLITINIKNKMDVKMPYALRKSVGDCITKLVDASVTELKQTIRALEVKLTEQNHVNYRLKDEIRRLYTELTKTTKKNSSLVEQVKAFQERANSEALMQKVYQNYALDLAEKCYDVSVSAEKGLVERRRKCLAYRNLRNKYELLKSKYKPTVKHGGKCEKTNLLDPESEQEMDELADEAMGQEMALVSQCQKELKDNFKIVFQTPPMVQQFKVEKVKNAEALNRCRMEVLEDIKKSPLSRLKAMEAILTKKKREHDYVWKGVINKQNLSLHETVGGDCPVLTKLLLEYGASPNAEDRKGNTPLHYAARNGNAVVGRALVEAGAHVNVQNSRKMTPLHVALYHKHIYFSLMLLRSQTDVTLLDDSHNTALHLAALLGSAIVVGALIEKGADVNAADLDGDTPIFNAAIGGNEVTGNVLASKGADLSAINNYGSTPLHAAAWEGCTSFCIFLLNQGVPVDPMNSQNVTPLHLAAMENEGDIVQLLITGGARVNCLDEKTDSPLHYAAKFGNVPMMKTLLRAGANVSAVNALRRTPLHLAAAKGHTEACSLLINAKSDVNASDERDRTPLHMVAMYGGSISVAEVLVKKGANVTAVDRNGLTPFDLGYTFKNVEFAAWLEEEIFARDGRREKGSVRKRSRRGKK